MQTIDDTLALLRRQAEIESAMKHAGGVRITVERELHAIRRQLERCPEAVEAIFHAAHVLRKPITILNGTDVDAWAPHDKVA
jgi:uncharacterized repeat protein (TIGR04076 family)